ncbi:2-oxoglutarate dehydrogenase complex dihydrolipoyllysine-residue succinyltransferase [bacterium]|jgi:2-oxoglutarate dehydrogenase E2 component (dihydrolipoamide succinyltransferase)|nr:2-oxoglutarate dehydrogenase complex dihydrolipoyllysine-residue succinyltransferase [bacterium]
MEKKNIVIPAAGESVTEGEIVEWQKEDGDFVEMDDVLLEIETEKASMELTAEASGTLKISVEEGVVKVGDVIGHILVGVSGAGPAKSGDSGSSDAKETSVEPVVSDSDSKTTYASGTPSVAAGKLMREAGVTSVAGTGRDGRVTKEDVQQAVRSGAEARTSESKIEPPKSTKDQAPKAIEKPLSVGRTVERKRMSLIRRTIAKRLIEAQQSAALLTTFNEIDMKPVMDIRKQYKDKFKDTHGIGLGFMSFFTAAVVEGLKSYPLVNSQIDGDSITSPNYCDIGIAVSTPKGLVVPVVRDAETKSFSQIETDIREYALRGRDGKLTMDDMEGGTFTITNGGVFGSMLSTPIVNRPQSGILGMHNIVQRAVVVNGEIVIRPMMYVALTYDHRIIDGSQAVGFLVKVKEMIEDPVRLVLHL